MHRNPVSDQFKLLSDLGCSRTLRTLLLEDLGRGSEHVEALLNVFSEGGRQRLIGLSESLGSRTARENRLREVNSAIDCLRLLKVLQSLFDTVDHLLEQCERVSLLGRGVRPQELIQNTFEHHIEVELVGALDAWTQDALDQNPNQRQ